MLSEDQMMQQLMETFKAEAEEHIRRITQMILALERGEVNQEMLEELFREAHSLKGAARAVELNDISAVAHKIEALLSALKSGDIPFSDDLADLIYEGLDGISAMLGDEEFNANEFAHKVDSFLSVNEKAKSGEKIKPDDRFSTELTPSHKAGRSMMYVDISKLDRLMERVGEIIAAKISGEEYLRSGYHILKEIERIHRKFQEERRDGVERLERIIGTYRDFLDDMESICRNISRLSDELNEDVKSLRLQPLSILFDSFDRMVRDISKQEGKKVRLEKIGGNTEIDRRILEELREPLMHLLRNAIDHGIERPQERVKAGKEEYGTIRISARGHGDRVIIEVEDDGRGIDLERIKETALKSGLIEETEEMSEEEILNLIFKQGLSTSSEVTEISGRGIGLNVVWRKVESLKGTITVHTELGKGCRFTLSLPLTLMITKVLIVEVNGDRYAIPASYIDRTLRIKRSEMVEIGDRSFIRHNESLVSLIPLSALLELEGGDIGEEIRVLILRFGGRAVGIMVDDLVVEQDIVVQGFSRPLVRIRNVSGAAISSDGRVLIVLNPMDLVRTACKLGSTSISPLLQKAKPKTILVVEDSITTRTLERNILESAGYNVVTAKDGVEAKEILRRASCDLVVSDVRMPNMDGFQLTSWIKNHSDLKDIPVILVTSMESEEDRRRGLEVGADAYFIKSGFNQEELLEMIERLI
ncbi:hybrid sensor histidine kinase/response regulator [Candidatus Poribacteria bacterium]|nr:hybrid sensor histidine kinase/response regulator [Candidatus Poribacteria bacterium]